jgi:hypothetical protein
MTRGLAIVAALVSIGVIGLVLLWGTTGRAGAPPFEAAVLVLNVATPLASLLLTWHLWRDGQRGAAILSSTPILLMAIVTVVALGGTVPPLNLLLWLDLYVLLVFVVVLNRVGRQLLRPRLTLQ